MYATSVPTAEYRKDNGRDKQGLEPVLFDTPQIPAGMTGFYWISPE
jgi:hypothetical protein